MAMEGAWADDWGIFYPVSAEASAIIDPYMSFLMILPDHDFWLSMPIVASMRFDIVKTIYESEYIFVVWDSSTREIVYIMGRKSG
jgi:hypothetical protein